MTEFGKQVCEVLGPGCDTSSAAESSKEISVGDSEALAEGARIHVNIEVRSNSLSCIFISGNCQWSAQVVFGPDITTVPLQHVCRVGM